MALPFKALQPKKRSQIVAIDLGSRTTKAVHLQRKGVGFELLSYSILDTPVADKSAPYAKLPEHLKQLMQDLGARTKQVAFALGVSDAMLRQVDLPFLPAADLRQMLKFNTKNYLQQELPDHVFDSFFFPPKGGTVADSLKPGQKCKALVGACKRQLITDLVNAAKEAGLSVEMVVPGLVGTANAFELSQPELFEKEVLALIDIGYKHTTISVLENGQLALTRMVGIGGEKLTGGLAESLGVSSTEAEAMKIALSEELQWTMRTLLDPLGKELHDSIFFYSTQAERTVNQVFFSGGSARSEFIINTLREQLSTETRTWNPLGTIQPLVSSQKLVELEQVAPQLAVAVGTALAAL